MTPWNPRCRLPPSSNRPSSSSGTGNRCFGRTRAGWGSVRPYRGCQQVGVCAATIATSAARCRLYELRKRRVERSRARRLLMSTKPRRGTTPAAMSTRAAQRSPASDSASSMVCGVADTLGASRRQTSASRPPPLDLLDDGHGEAGAHEVSFTLGRSSARDETSPGSYRFFGPLSFEGTLFHETGHAFSRTAGQPDLWRQMENRANELFPSTPRVPSGGSAWPNSQYLTPPIGPNLYFSPIPDWAQHY